MTKKDFVNAYPRLYHMATAQALATIHTFGLLSTNRILEICTVDDQRADQLRSRRRPEMTRLETQHHEVFFLRDQKPLRDKALEQCLDNMTVEEWYRSLNSRVFMWASKERVEKLLGARAYRTHDQLLLTVDSTKFADKYFDQIEVSTMNSGATLYTPLRRGPQTFTSLTKFIGGKGSKPIVEVTVIPSIPDFAKFILHSEVRRAAA